MDVKIEFYKGMKFCNGRYVPNRVMVDVTNRCNLNCIHCSQNSQRKVDKLEPSKEFIFCIFNEVKKAMIPRVFILGGEPFMRKDLLEIIGYGISIGLKIDVISHGLFLSKNIIKELKNIGVYRMQFSLYGLTEHTHDTFVGKKGAFKSLMHKINFLKKYDISMSANFILSKLSFHECLSMDYLNVLNNLPLHQVCFWDIEPVGRARKKNDIFLSPAAYCNIYEYFMETKPFNFTFLISKKYSKNYNEDLKKGTIRTCGKMLTNSLSISRNGEVSPCSTINCFKEFSLGSLKSKSLFNMLYEDGYIEHLRNNARPGCPFYKSVDMGNYTPVCRIYRTKIVPYQTG